MSKPHVRFQRANFVVSDMRRALEFYVGVLGLTLEFKKESEPTSYSYEVFAIPPEAKVRFAVLSAPNQPRVMALTEITGIGIGGVPHPRRSCIVLETPDIDGVADRARKGGFTLCEEGELVTNDGRRGRELGILDADGNLTVVYNITD